MSAMIAIDIGSRCNDLWVPCLGIGAVNASKFLRAERMKVHVSVNRRCPWCFYVRRRGHLYVACKMHGRHKQRQGTKLGIKYVNNKRKYKGWFSTNAFYDVNYDKMEIIDGQIVFVCDENESECNDLFGYDADSNNRANLIWNKQFNEYSSAFNSINNDPEA